MELVKLKGHHVLSVLDRDPTSQYLRPHFTTEVLDHLEESDSAYTILLDGTPVLVGGVTVFYPGRGEAWSILDQHCTEFFLPMHKMVRRFLDKHPLRRIEASTPVDFYEGHRWLKLLGFELEAPRCKCFGIDGGDYALYAKVRN